MKFPRVNNQNTPWANLVFPRFCKSLIYPLVDKLNRVMVMEMLWKLIMAVFCRTNGQVFVIWIVKIFNINCLVYQ